MIRKKLFLLMVSVLLGSVGANAFRLVTDSIETIEPVVSIVPDDTGVSVEYIFPGAFIEEDDIFHGTYTLGRQEGFMWCSLLKGMKLLTHEKL